MQRRFAFRAVIAAAFAAAVSANPNAVGQTPTMGWSGYNAFMQNSGHCDKAGAGGYNETTFVQTMDALTKTGLADLGYVYLNADDCWIAENRTKDGKLTHDLTRFPHGMPWLIEQAHSKKLKLGLYAAASVETCRAYPGSQGYEVVDATTFADWGADFVKLDSCGGTLNNGTEAWVDQYGKWSETMNKSGSQIVFSCSWAVYFTICAAKYPPLEWEQECGVVPWQNHYISDICHLWRYGEDLSPTWTTRSAPEKRGGGNMNGGGGSGVADVIEFASSFWASAWREQTGPGAVNDPDFLVVGCPTDRPCEAGATYKQKGMSNLEQRTQFSFWCLLAAPLIIGSDIRNLSPEALATLSNKDAIKINQDVAAYNPRALHHTAYGKQVWTRQLGNGDFAVILYNGGESATDVTVVWSDIYGRASWIDEAAVAVYNVWSKDTSKHKHSFTASSVEAHDAIFLRISTPERSCATVHKDGSAQLKLV